MEAAADSSSSSYLGMYMLQQESPDVISAAFRVPKGTVKQSLDISITKTTVKAGLKGQPPIIEGTLVAAVKGDSMWGLEREAGLVTLELEKKSDEYWPFLIAGPRRGQDLSTMDAHSLFILGCVGLDSPQSKESLDKALNYLQVSAERGHPASLCELGRLYLNGMELRLRESDPTSSSSSFSKQVTFTLSKDVDKAYELFLRAADEGGSSQACFQVALFHHLGGMGKQPRDLPRAITYYKRCEEVVPMACFNLGLIHLQELEHYDLVAARQYFLMAVAKDPTLEKDIPPLFAQEWKKFEDSQKALRAAELKRQSDASRAALKSSAQKLKTSTPTTKTTTIQKKWDTWTIVGAVAAVAVIGGIAYQHFRPSSPGSG
ncbi:CS domain-containing protein [Balamuthia mandrillaris]